MLYTRMSGTWMAAWVCLLLAGWPAWGQNQNVTVNEQPTAEQRLGEVNELRKSNRHDAAAELLQELIEQSRFRLVGVGKGRYTDAERWCREELFRDGVLREAYRQRYTALATRALEQAQDAEQPAEALAQVYHQYTATAPALEAGLQLAGRLLEAGDAATASTLVAELLRHPDRETQAARLELLRGAVAVYTHHGEQAEAAREKLIEMGQNDQAQWLESLPEALDAAAVADRPGLVDAGPKPDELRVSLWEQPLAEVERSMTWLRGEGVLPVVTSNLALINNGRQVVAMDRASGQRLWVYPADDSSDVLRSVGGYRWYDARAVGRGGGAVCAVLGESCGITENRNPYVPQNRLSCIDEMTGQERWTRKSGDLEPGEPTLWQSRRPGRANLQYTHFVGTPIVVRGQVLALLRRASNQGQGTQTTWLMSFDLEDGSLRWFRHLALSSLSYSSDQMRVSPQMVVHGDTLYITDCIATAAAIDINRGGYRWLRVLPVGYGQSLRLTIETDGMHAPPVLTHAGLLVPLSLSRDRLVLLDPKDGSTLQTFENNPQAASAQYLLDSGDGAIVVSTKSVSFWDADKASIVWTFALDPAEKVTGRGDVTRRFVIVPTSSRLVVLDRETGKLLDSVESSGGNVVVSGSEVLTVSTGRLSSYTSWQRARQRLVDRAREQPTDPTAGLALASLALRLGDKTEAMMEGVGYAIAAIERQDPAQAVPTRQRVFDQLRALASAADAVDADTRRELYDRLALTTYTAAQEVAYHLDVGRFYAELGEADRAVQHFQAVVADPDFASQAYQQAGITRAAGAVAQQSIYQLIEEHGRSVYGRYDALARARLAEIKAQGKPETPALVMIARRYPMSLAAVEALLQAGQGLEQQGRPIGAVGLYQQAVVRSTQPQQRQLAVGRLLSFYLENGQPDRAEDLLTREARLRPDLYPMDDGQPLPPSAWRERIAKIQAKPLQRRDLSDKLTKPYLLPGRMLHAAPGIDPATLSDRLLLQHNDNTLTSHHADDPQKTVWTASLPADARRWLVLTDGDEQTLIWSPDANHVIALHPATGKELWSTPLGFEADPLAREWQGDAEDSRVLFALSDAVLCFGERSSAKLVVIDRAGGGVLWRTRLEVGELTALDCDAWTLAAAGRVGQFAQNASGKLVLLSLFTGEPQTDQPSLLVNLSPSTVFLRAGRVMLSGSTKIVAVDPVSGAEVWSRAFAERGLTGRAALAGPLFAVEGNDGFVHAIDVDQGGRQLGQVLVEGRPQPDALELHALGEEVWVRSEWGVYRLGLDPVLRWRDAVRPPFKRTVHAMISQSRVAMIAMTDPDQDPGVLDPARSFALYILDREGGRLLSEYTLGPISDLKVNGLLDPTDAKLFNNGLAVPVGWHTMVVPAAAGQE